MKTSMFAALVAIAAALGAGVAEARTVRIPTQAVDFSNAAAVMLLHDRIVGAARTVCRGQGLPGLQGRAYERDCQIAAIEDAIAMSGWPALAAAHQAIPEAQRYARGAPVTDEVTAAIAATGQIRADADRATTLAAAAPRR